VINLDGYIKLFRKLLDNPIICKDSDYLAVWVYLLLNATHREQPALFRGQKIILKPGQLITGRISISTKLNISESKVQRILKSFENEQQIEQQASNQNRLITILNWTEYQQSEQQNEHPVNNKRTTSEQQVNTNKNVKNDKNERINIYSDNPELNTSILQFIEFRKKIKAPMTDRAIELLISKLQKLSPDIQTQIAIINQSILNGWKGVFPLKEPEQPKQNKFNQHPQRPYSQQDYVELEKKLLRRDLSE